MGTGNGSFGKRRRVRSVIERLGPVRTCIGCRERSSPEGLLRVVLVHGVITPDEQAVRPGRGAWLHPGCLEAAERRRAFTRALRATGAPDLSVLREFVERTHMSEHRSR